MISELQKVGILRVVGEGCNCSSRQQSYSYTLPSIIDDDITKYLEVFGKPSLSLSKNAILKIENQDFSITGIKNFKQIKLILKNSGIEILVNNFENALISWAESRKND